MRLRPSDDRHRRNRIRPRNASCRLALHHFALTGEPQPQRSQRSSIPDTPTTAEAGFPDYKERGWFALLAPAKTPKPILERLSREVAAATKDPAVKAGFEKVGAETMWMPLEQVKQWHKGEIAKYRDIISKAGIAKIE